MRAARAAWPSPELDALATARPRGAHQPIVLGLAARVGRPDAAGRRVRGRLRERQRPGHRHRPPAQPRPLRRHRRPGPPRRRPRPGRAAGRRGRAARPGRGRATRCPPPRRHCSTSPPNSTPPAGTPVRLLTTSPPRPVRLPSTGAAMHLHHSHAFAEDHPHSPGRTARRHPDRRPDGRRRALRIGLGGPVGSGKTATVAALCRALRDELSIAVVTNDIYTREDAEFLLREAVLPAERIRAVETGACPHTAIRDDISANLEAVEDLEEQRRPARPDPGRIRRGQPHRDLLQGPGRRPDLRHRRRGRRRHPPQGRPRRDHRRPARHQQDRPRPLRRRPTWRAWPATPRTQRGDLPVAFTSLKTEGGVTPVADWVRARLAAWTAGAA